MTLGLSSDIIGAMVQFYFLSIVANLLGGIALAEGYLAERIPLLQSIQESLTKRGTKTVIGFSTAIVGLLKLIVAPIAPVDNMGVPVVGDLLPALVGLGIGAVLLVDALREKVTVPDETVESVEKKIVPYRVPLGLAGIAVSILHFFLPGALFL